MSTRRLLVIPVALAISLVVPPIGADGATSVAIGGTSRSGSTLSVTGTASFADQPFVTLGTDPVGDQHIPHTEATGIDLTEFAMSSTVGGSIVFRWTVSQLPPQTGRAPHVIYGNTFCVAGADPANCWAIFFEELLGVDPFGTDVAGWKCADETCNLGYATYAYVSGNGISQDAAAKTVTASVPEEALGVTPGSRLVAVTPADAPFLGSVFSTAPYGLGTGGKHINYDGTAINAPYDVPAATVSLAIGDPGQSPDGVAYTGTAEVGEDGTYAGSIDVGSLSSGSYAVYARACFGANNCAYATQPVTI